MFSHNGEKGKLVKMVCLKTSEHRGSAGPE